MMSQISEIRLIRDVNKQKKNNKVRLGKDTRPYIMPESRSINIDEPIDLKLAELLLFERQIV